MWINPHVFYYNRLKRCSAIQWLTVCFNPWGGCQQRTEWNTPHTRRAAKQQRRTCKPKPRRKIGCGWLTILSQNEWERGGFQLGFREMWNARMLLDDQRPCIYTHLLQDQKGQTHEFFYKLSLNTCCRSAFLPDLFPGGVGMPVKQHLHHSKKKKKKTALKPILMKFSDTASLPHNSKLSTDTSTNEILCINI